ncbi:helix-turn-helix domain-containing protein [Pseudomonas alloputida]|uniref:helix-turn-helix transcriptional regulator n=1 Tax=Pseudomonas alloputida TaxID=1940621 RepID=UPI003865EF45
MKEELAITLRAIRRMKGMGYESLAGTISQSNLSLLEQGKIQATLPTLLKIADTLDVSLLTIMALCLAIRDHKTPERELLDAQAELQSFMESGGLELMEAQTQDGVLKKRERGIRANAERISAVIDLKRQGMTQAETARELGLPKSTVQRYWQED